MAAVFDTGRWSVFCRALARAQNNVDLSTQRAARIVMAGVDGQRPFITWGNAGCRFGAGARQGGLMCCPAQLAQTLRSRQVDRQSRRFFLANGCLRSMRPTALARGAVDLGEFSPLSAGAILSIEPHALPGRLRHIAQVTSWSASSLPPLLRGVVVAIIYFVFAKSSLSRASLHPSASPVWPPSGLALASLLLCGNGLWPAIAAGSFLANAMTFGSLSTSCLIAGGNTLEALITVALLERFKASTDLFEGSSQVVLFACLTLLPGTMISATMGVGSLVLGGFADPANFPAFGLL
jgi:MASE1